MTKEGDLTKRVVCRGWGVCPRGSSGGCLTRGVFAQGVQVDTPLSPPYRLPLQRTVCILLECILVVNKF